MGESGFEAGFWVEEGEGEGGGEEVGFKDDMESICSSA